MLTAVTQVDAAGGSARQMRTFRQQSYYRSSSNGAGGAPFKEQVSLLQVGNTVTPHLMRKSSSVRSPHPNHSAAIIGRHVAPGCLREKQQLLLQSTPPPSTLVLNYDSQRGGVGIGVANGLKLMGGVGVGVGGVGLLGENDEHVSSV